MKSKSIRLVNIMRSTIACGLVLLSLSSFSQSNNYYWYKGTKIPLELINNKKFVLFKNDNVDSTLSFLNSNGWKVIKSDKDLTINSLNPFLKGDPIEEYTWAVIEKMKGGDADLSLSQIPEYMHFISPFFSSADGAKVGLSHLFYVRLHKAEDIYLLVQKTVKLTT